MFCPRLKAFTRTRGKMPGIGKPVDLCANMARYSTFPTLYDEVLTLSISGLKKWGYLVLHQWKRGTITWRIGDQKTGSVGIFVNMEETFGYLEFKYNFREEAVNYRVPLESRSSNLGKGLVWYFRCPTTGKRCRKLYGVGKFFLHREAFRGCMYESQAQSKSARQVSKAFGWLFEGPNIEEELKKKYRKRVYRGKPTPLQRKLERVEEEGMKAFLAFEEAEKGCFGSKGKTFLL